MGIFKKIATALKPDIELFDRNPKMGPFGKLDKYPDNMVEEYNKDKKEWDLRGEQK